MSKFIIQGGRPLAGELRLVGNKNAALPMLAASLLTDEPVTLRNMPRIDDVRVMLDLLAGLGVEVAVKGGAVTLCARGLHTRDLDPDLCRKVRSSILFAGPLCARHGRVSLPPPGGDVIGHRRLDAHFKGLCALGMRLEARPEGYTLVRERLRGTFILLDEASVTATENLLMAAVLTPGTTVLYNAACEPHVQDLGRLLIRMGAHIEGLGTNRVTVRGVRRLGGAVHTVGCDYTELGSFIAASAATGGALTVSGLNDGTSLPVMERVFRQLGVTWEVKGARLELPARQDLRIVQDLHAAIPKIEDGIWPAYPSDLMSVSIVLATQAQGTVLFFEKLFESRMYFVDQLIGMGARIVQCDPHRVVVSGASPLRAASISSPDIRAGMALIIAALCAEGRSVIDRAEVIDRGYERIDQRLRALGAEIERV